MDKDIITVYLLLKSRGELSWEELLRESGVDDERLSRILLLLHLKRRVKKEGDKYVYVDIRGYEEGGDSRLLECTDYRYERFRRGEKADFSYQSLSDLLKLRIKKEQPLEVPFDGKTLRMNLVVDLDRGDGKIELSTDDKQVLSIPHYIDSDSLVIDLYELFQFYKRNAERKGADFVISKAYGLFHKIANCEISGDEHELLPCNITSPLEFDAASACIQICQAITETLRIESVTTTIDTITRSSQCSSSEIEKLRRLDFLKNHEISTAYTFPLSPFETGTLVMGKDGVPLCLLSSDNLFARIPVRETGNSIEIDFSEVVERYVEAAKMNNGRGLDLDKISNLFSSMFNEEEKTTFELEESLNMLKTREEMDLLNTMYLISSLTIENQSKEVSARIRYKL